MEGNKENPLEHNAEKQRQWDEISRKVELIVDRLGMPIEENIREMVISIQANGLGTTASCEGHLDRGFPYPWLDIESIGAQKNHELEPRFSLLFERNRLDGENMSDADREELNKMIEEQIESNSEAYTKLSNLLNEFFVSKAIESPTLAIKKGPWNQSRLQPSGTIKEQDSQEKTEAEVERALESFREDLNKFAMFLKEKFFNSK